MIGLSILGIATKGAETNNLVVMGKYFLALIVIPGIIELLVRFCQRGIARKFDVSKNLKIYKFFTRISIIILMVPVFIFVQLPMLDIKISLFNDSDVLAYYGAVIGGVGTVLGVYWTLNYESEKSKEERRKDSLPILRFYFRPLGFFPEDIQPNDCVHEKRGSKRFENYDVLLDTTNGSRRYSKSSIHVFGRLMIQNIGLGPAIISDVKLIRTKQGNIEVKNTGTLKSNKYLLLADNKNVDFSVTFWKPDRTRESIHMCIRSDDLNEDDILQFIFMDLYSNEYFYNIPFFKVGETLYSDSYNIENIKISEDDVEIIPNWVPTKK